MNIEYGTIKYKIMIALVLGGEYPYKSLDLINASGEGIREGINQLREQGYLDIKMINDKKRIRLKMFRKRKGEYINFLFKGAESCEPVIRNNGERKLERKDRIAELLITMIESGINITPDTKPKSDEKETLDEKSKMLPYFITSLEARAIITIKEDKSKGARFHGTVVSLGGMYNIYNMGNSMMEWIRPAEKTAVDFNEEYSLKIMPWGKDYADWYGNSAIIFSRNLDYMVDFVKGNVTPRRGRGISKTPVNINDYYVHTFYLPLNRKGQVMLNIMTKKKWHYYLVGMFINAKRIATPEVKMSIACDGTVEGCYILVFLDGDIGRLKRFVNVKIDENSKGKYRIICYEFQEAYVRKLAPSGMEVQAFDFKTVTDAFFQIYEKFETKAAATEANT